MEERVFDIWVASERYRGTRPHYPGYKVFNWKLGTATSLGQAERMLRSYISDGAGMNVVHSFTVREIPLDRICGEASLASYLYDKDGIRIDARTYSTIANDNGIYCGRTPSQIRFREGDIVEVRTWDDEIRLGIIVGLPPGTETAERFNSNPRGFKMDDTDDSYTVIFDSSFYHEHVDSLHIFEPRYKIHPALERRLRNTYNDYVTYPARLEIMNTTAREQIMDFFNRHGMEGTVPGATFIKDDFQVILNLPSGPQEVFFDKRKALADIDRVCCTLARIAGLPVTGKGFRLQKENIGDSIIWRKVPCLWKKPHT